MPLCAEHTTTGFFAAREATMPWTFVSCAASARLDPPNFMTITAHLPGP